MTSDEWTGGTKRYLRYYHSERALFKNRLYNLALGMIRVWSTQKVDTLRKLVTLRLGILSLSGTIIMAITTDGDGIMLKLGRQVQCEHIACLSQTLHLLAGHLLYEKCSLRTMQGTLQNIRV